MVVLGVELVAPPVESEPVVPDGELVLPELELELEPGPPIELVLLPGDELLLVVESVLLVLPLVLGLVLAVLGLVGAVLLDELVAPGPPAEPVVASRLVQAPSERAATTARDAAAH